MATEPVLSGEIPAGGVLDILRDIEARRITGKLRFVIGSESGEVELVGGQIAMDQDPLPNGADPVEALLQARGGIFAVHAILPPLSVSQGGDHERRGSLAVHVPADLMTYCEQAGLTGVLELRNEGRVVEVLYEAGELLGIRLDGREEADLDEVFAWDQGSFRIVLRGQEDVRSRLPPAMSVRPPEAPEDPSDREPTVRYARPSSQALPTADGGATSRYAKASPTSGGREDTGKNFLRVMEMALTEVVSVREKARASVRSAPPPKARPSVRPPSTKARKDSTVRIVWIGGEPSVEQEIPARARAAAGAEDKPSEASAKPSEASAKPSEASAKPSEASAKPSEAATSARGDDEPAASPERTEAVREPAPLPGPAPNVEPVPSDRATIALLVAVLVGLAAVAWTFARG